MREFCAVKVKSLLREFNTHLLERILTIFFNKFYQSEEFGEWRVKTQSRDRKTFES